MKHMPMLLDASCIRRSSIAFVPMYRERIEVDGSM
jgi:hypothetical protein